MREYSEKEFEFVKRLLNDRKSMDSQEVEEWLEVRENRELLDCVTALRHRFLQIDFDEKAGYARVMQELFGRNIVHRVGRWAAVASIVLLLGLGGYWWHRNWQAEQLLPMAQKGGNGVELTLATGEQVMLEGKNAMIAGCRETGIREDTLMGLDYSRASVTGTEEVFNTLKVPVGGFYTLKLSDGTKVWVNALSELRFPVTFTGSTRKVYLHGEAYFDVEHRDSLPFVVVTDEVEVKVYGTEFNVNAYAEKPVKVVLVEGVVGVRLPESRQEVALRPNQLAEYARGMREIQVSDVNPYAYIAWKEGEFVFERETVEEIMERLSYWYDMEVFYANDDVKKQVFSGNINRSEHMEDILHLIGEVAIVRFDIKGKIVTVKSVE